MVISSVLSRYLFRSLLLNDLSVCSNAFCGELKLKKTHLPYSSRALFCAYGRYLVAFDWKALDRKPLEIRFEHLLSCDRLPLPQTLLRAT